MEVMIDRAWFPSNVNHRGTSMGAKRPTERSCPRGEGGRSREVN